MRFFKLLLPALAAGALLFSPASASAAYLHLEDCRGGLLGSYSTDNDTRYWYNIAPANFWVGLYWDDYNRTSDWRIAHWMRYKRFDGQNVYKKFICNDANRTGKLASSEDWPVIS
jgi:hypothetical protein